MASAIRRLGLGRFPRVRRAASDAASPAQPAAAAETASLEERAVHAAPAIARELLGGRSDAVVSYPHAYGVFERYGLVEASDDPASRRTQLDAAVVALHAVPDLYVFDVCKNGEMRYQLVRF